MSINSRFKTRNQSKTCDASQSHAESPHMIDIKFRKKSEKSHTPLHIEDAEDTLNIQPYDPEENEQYSKLSSLEGSKTY